jgi:hypothetical protein
LRFSGYVLINYILKHLSRKLEINRVAGTEYMDSQTSDSEQETLSHFDDGNIFSDSISLDVKQETEMLFIVEASQMI